MDKGRKGKMKMRMAEMNKIGKFKGERKTQFKGYRLDASIFQSMNFKEWKELLLLLMRMKLRLHIEA